MENRAPFKVVEYYARLIQDPEERFNVSSRYKLYNVAVDSLIDLLNKEKIIHYRDSVLVKIEGLGGAELIARINKALKNPILKWK